MRDSCHSLSQSLTKAVNDGINVVVNVRVREIFPFSVHMHVKTCGGRKEGKKLRLKQA